MADPARRLDLTDGLAFHQLRDRTGPTRQQDLQVLPPRGGEIEGHVEDMPLRGRADANLLGRAIEGALPREVDDVLFSARSRRRARADGCPDRARGRSKEQATAREMAVRIHRTTAIDL